MNHYFTNNQNLKEELKVIDVQILGTSFRFLTNSGVFSKNNLDYGSRVLIENIELDKTHEKIIDMGCGYGPIGISIAKLYNKHVDMVDINERAVELANENIKLNKVSNCKAVVGNLFDDIEEKFDCVITNPPIRTGKKNIFSLYEQAHAVLNDNGLLYIVIQKKQGAPSTYKYLQDIFKNVDVVVKQGGYWIIKATK